MPPKKKTTRKKRVPVKPRAAGSGSGTARKAVPRRKVAAKVKPNNVAAPHVPIHDSTTVPLVMYRRIAVTFVVIVGIALLSVLYLATMQAVIHIDAVQTPITSELIVSAVTTPINDTDIPAEILSGTLGKTMEVAPTGAGAVEVDAVATGEITIYNNMTFAQPLVKTTRFLSADGVLFRLSDQVSVPAGSSVTAQVYADEEGAGGNISATSFTIPGLSSSRQTLVFGESSQTFTGGTVSKSVVSSEEMEEAADTLYGELLQDAMEMIRKEATGGYGAELFDVEVQERSFSIEPDTQAESYEVSITIQVGAIFYDQETLETLVVRKLYEGLGQGQEFSDTGLSALEISVESYSKEDGVASLLTTLNGQAVTSRASSGLYVGRFVGMNGDEVRKLLVDEGVAEDVWVEFFPFWVNTIPRLKDHIYIEVE